MTLAITLPINIESCRSLALVVQESSAVAAEQSAPVTFRKMTSGKWFCPASVLSEAGKGQTYENLSAVVDDESAELIPWVDATAQMIDEPAGGSAPQTPSTISARQIRLWLVRQGIALAAVEAAIDAITDQPTRDSVRVEWEYAPYVERSHPWLVPLAQSLGLDDAGVDAAFREAATL